MEGCPVGAGWLTTHKNHPVRLRLPPLQRRGMGYFSRDPNRSFSLRKSSQACCFCKGLPSK